MPLTSSAPSQFPSKSFPSAAFFGGASSLASPFHASVNVPGDGTLDEISGQRLRVFRERSLERRISRHAFDAEGHRLSLNGDPRQHQPWRSSPGNAAAPSHLSAVLATRSIASLSVLPLDGDRAFQCPDPAGVDCAAPRPLAARSAITASPTLLTSSVTSVSPTAVESCHESQSFHSIPYVILPRNVRRRLTAAR